MGETERAVGSKRERVVREEGWEKESYCLQVRTFEASDGTKVGRLTRESE